MNCGKWGWGWGQEIISKECIISGKATLLRGNGRGLSGLYPLVLTRKFYVGGLEVTFLGKLETVMRLGIKSWFTDVGP